MGQHKAQFEQLGVQTVAISFGTPFWVDVWLQETNSPFPLLLDQGREGYRAFSLESSRLRSWSPQTMWYYAKAMLGGEKLVMDRGDTNQLGGDFVIDNAGILRYLHPSRDPTDRPSIEQLFSVLQQLS